MAWYPCGAEGDGTNVKYEISYVAGTDHYKVTISGKGRMQDYPLYPKDNTEKSPWARFRKDTSHGTQRVQEIEVLCSSALDPLIVGEHAFSNMYYPRSTSLYIGPNVSSIPANAFFGFFPGHSLFSISQYNNYFKIDGDLLLTKSDTEPTLVRAFSASGDYIMPSNTGVKIIGEEAFAHLNELGSSQTQLKSVVIPEGVTTIEKNAFSYCESLTQVSIPKSLKSVDTSTGNPFLGCYKLSTIRIAPGNNNFTYSPLSGTATAEKLGLLTAGLYEKVLFEGTYQYKLIRSVVGVNFKLWLDKSVTEVCPYAIELPNYPEAYGFVIVANRNCKFSSLDFNGIFNRSSVKLYGYKNSSLYNALKATSTDSNPFKGILYYISGVVNGNISCENNIENIDSSNIDTDPLKVSFVGSGGITSVAQTNEGNFWTTTNPKFISSIFNEVYVDPYITSLPYDVLENMTPTVVTLPSSSLLPERSSISEIFPQSDSIKKLTINSNSTTEFIGFDDSRVKGANLEELNLPDSIEKISYIQYSTKLKSFKLPKSLKSVANFFNNSSENYQISEYIVDNIEHYYTISGIEYPEKVIDVQFSDTGTYLSQLAVCYPSEGNVNFYTFCSSFINKRVYKLFVPSWNDSLKSVHAKYLYCTDLSSVTSNTQIKSHQFISSSSNISKIIPAESGSNTQVTEMDKCGDKCWYTYVKSSETTGDILNLYSSTYGGVLSHYSPGGYPWNGIEGANLKTVKVKGYIYELPEKIFYNNTSLTNFIRETAPENIDLSDYKTPVPFSDNSEKIPLKLGKRSFSGCSSLNSVNFLSSDNDLEGSFAITLPSSTGFVFENCTSLGSNSTVIYLSNITNLDNQTIYAARLNAFNYALGMYLGGYDVTTTGSDLWRAFHTKTPSDFDTAEIYNNYLSTNPTKQDLVRLRTYINDVTGTVHINEYTEEYISDPSKDIPYYTNDTTDEFLSDFGSNFYGCNNIKKISTSASHCYVEDNILYDKKSSPRRLIWVPCGLGVKNTGDLFSTITITPSKYYINTVLPYAFSGGSWGRIVFTRTSSKQDFQCTLQTNSIYECTNLKQTTDPDQAGRGIVSYNKEVSFAVNAVFTSNKDEFPTIICYKDSLTDLSKTNISYSNIIYITVKMYSDVAGFIYEDDGGYLTLTSYLPRALQYNYTNDTYIVNPLANGVVIVHYSVSDGTETVLESDLSFPFDTVDSNAFSGFSFDDNKTISIVINKTVVSGDTVNLLLKDYAFADANGISSITLPGNTICISEQLSDLTNCAIFFNSDNIARISVDSDDNLSVDSNILYVKYNSEYVLLYSPPKGKDAEYKINLTKGYTYINKYAFYRCLKVNAFTGVTTDSGILYKDSKKTLFRVPEQYTLDGNLVTSIEVSKDINSIATFAFNHCDNIKSITVLNPACVFPDDETAYFPKDVVIYGYVDSTAEAYAWEKKIKFFAINTKQFNINDQDHYISVLINGDPEAFPLIRDTTVLDEFFRYILPTGYIVDYEFNSSVPNTASEIIPQFSQNNLTGVESYGSNYKQTVITSKDKAADGTSIELPVDNVAYNIRNFEEEQKLSEKSADTLTVGNMKVDTK